MNSIGFKNSFLSKLKKNKKLKKKFRRWGKLKRHKSNQKK